MSDMEKLMVWIPALPLLAALVTAALGKFVLKKHSHVPAVIAMALSFLLSLMLLSHVS